jgi:hypothetical protein
MTPINLSYNTTFDSHRSGWKYVLDTLSPLHADNGIQIDGFIDGTFGWSMNWKLKHIPYKKPWIGFFHNPLRIPPWVKDLNADPNDLIAEPAFVESLPLCKGIFTFSDYLTSFLKEKLPVEVETLRHPTEFPEITFSMDAFLGEKKVVQVGSWLRKLMSFYKFEAPGYTKYHLMGGDALKRFKEELEYYGIDCKNGLNALAQKADVTLISQLDNENFDILLSESIVFVDLYDSSVNNTIIECIVRDTPILVNRLSPIEEYLGADYPLYYASLDEIPGMLQDMSLIKSAHLYLKENSTIRNQLKGETFFNSFVNSNIYSRLS